MLKGGMEVPCIVEFKGSREEINKLKWVLDKQSPQRQNRERCHVKCSTDHEEPTEDAAEGRGGTDNKAVAWLKRWVVPVNAPCSLKTC